MIENASDVDFVASVVVEDATAKEPNFRYIAGKDIQQIVAAKKNMSDECLMKSFRR